MLSLNERGGWGGVRSTYIALASIITLALALLSSIWHPDVSGTVALLGLLAVYQTSSEMLLLYAVFSPASVVVDIIRLAGGSNVAHGRGFLIFFSICEMAVKLAGAVLSYSLYKSLASGEAGYLPASTVAQPFQQPFQPSSGSNGAPLGGNGNGNARAADPFTSYAPPVGDSQASYQPGSSTFPTSSHPGGGVPL